MADFYTQLDEEAGITAIDYESLDKEAGVVDKTWPEVFEHGYQRAGVQMVKGLAGVAKMTGELGGRFDNWSKKEPELTKDWDDKLRDWSELMLKGVDEYYKQYPEEAAHITPESGYWGTLKQYVFEPKNLVQGIIESAPLMLEGILGTVTGGAVLGIAAMAVPISGETYVDARKEGTNILPAFAQAIITGTGEAAIEQWTLGRKLGILKNFKKIIKGGPRRLLWEGTKAFFRGTTEEGTQEFNRNFWRWVFTDRSQAWSENVLESMAAGGPIELVMAGGFGAAGSVSTMVSKDQKLQRVEKIRNSVNENKEFTEEQKSEIDKEINIVEQDIQQDAYEEQITPGETDSEWWEREGRKLVDEHLAKSPEYQIAMEEYKKAVKVASDNTIKSKQKALDLIEKEAGRKIQQIDINMDKKVMQEHIQTRFAINVYRGVETGKLFPDESKLKMEQTETGTRLIDIESGEEAVLDQEASKGGIKKKVYEGKAYRSETQNMGIPEDATAADIINFEKDELGNEQDFAHLTSEQMDALKKRPASDLVWVASSKEKAASYGQEDLGAELTPADIEQVSDYTEDVKGGEIIAEDGDGGYLVLKPEAVEKPAIKKLTRRKALILGHKLPKIAGMDDAARRDFMEDITGKRSMKGMSLAEMRNYINALQDVTGKTAEIEPEDYKRPITLGRKATTMEAVIDETLNIADKLPERVKIPKHVRKQFIKKQRTGLWGKFKAFAYGIDNAPLFGLANILESGQYGVLTDVFDTNITHGRRIEAGHKRTVADAFTELREKAEITDTDLVKISKSLNPRTAFIQNIQENLDYGTEIKKIKIGKREYDLTRAELLDIFLMAQQEDGLRHLLGGGVVINGVETGALSEETIRGLIALVETDTQVKSLADIIHNVGENIWKPSLNQTAATLGEKEIATINKWWGLEVLHPTQLAGKQEQFNINFIENKSILKDRTKSKDPLIVRDALARFTGFENAIAEYIGMSQPTRIARTVLNNKEFTGIINRKGYKDVRENMFTILDRAQSIPAKQGSFDRFFKGVLPGIYRSVLFFNPRVIMSQFTSTTNYAAYVSPKYMALIKEGLSPAEVQKTLDMSDIAWDRFYMGHSSLELGELGASDATLKLLTKTSSDINKLGITLKLSDMGALTVGRKIAEAEYVDAQKGTVAGDSAAYWAGKDTSFEVDSQGWKRVVTDRAELLWQRSQPSWDKWSRSMITSDPAATRRLFFLFRSFHEKSLAILQEAQIEYKNSSKSAEDTARYSKKYGAVLSGYTINVALRALIMAGLVRKFKEPIQYLIDMITAPFAMLPVLGKILQSSIRGFINVLAENRAEYRGEAIESFPIRIINTIAKAPENFSRAAAYSITGETDKAADSIKKAVGQIYVGVGTSAGVPTSEINRVYGGWIKEEEPGTKTSKRKF